MSESTSIIALKAQIALGMLEDEQLAVMDRRTRREVQHAAMQMARIAKTHMLAQDAIGMVHMLTTNKVISTLTTAEFMKAMRSPIINGPELEQLDATLRARYLEAANIIAASATRSILNELD